MRKQEFVCNIEGYGELKVKIKRKNKPKDVAKALSQAVQKTMELVAKNDSSVIFHPVLGHVKKGEV